MRRCVRLVMAMTQRLERRLEALERQAAEQAAQRPPVREVVVWLTADGVATPCTVWTAPGVEPSYPRWEDPYHERRAAQDTPRSGNDAQEH